MLYPRPGNCSKHRSLMVIARNRSWTAVKCSVDVWCTLMDIWWIFDGYSFLAVVLQGHFGSSWVLQKSPRLHRAWVNPKSLQSLKMWYFVATIAEMTCVDPCPRWWKEQRCLGVFERSYIYIIYYIIFSCLNCQTRPAVGRRSRRIPARAGRWPGEKRWGSIAARWGSIDPTTLVGGVTKSPMAWY